MTKGREKSDGLHCTEKSSKGDLNPGTQGGGKAATASEGARQLELFSGTAESPKGDVAEADRGLPRPVTSAVPLPGNTKGTVWSTVTSSDVKLSHTPWWTEGYGTRISPTVGSCLSSNGGGKQLEAVPVPQQPVLVFG